MSQDPDDRVSPKPLGGTPKRYEDDLDEPPLPKLSGGGGEGLDSLAQAARKKHLQSARWALIIVGVLQILVSVSLFFVQERNLDPNLRNMVHLINGAFLTVGVVFVILGILVHLFPIACSVSGLVLFILVWVASIAIDLKNAYSGIIMRVIVISILFKAVQAAMAYQRESEAAPEEA